ncbi:MAG TPA: glutathione S-transferase family protein [Caulobacteraceae bacterium]|jgi:glutathione S-transferase
MSGELIFYTRPISRGRMVRWMLEEIGAPYEAVIVDELAGGEQAAAYRRLNPIGKVPTIVHNGQAISESPAILLYLAEAYPEANLGPTPATRGDFYRWLFFASGPMEAAMIDHLLGLQIPPERQQTVGYGTFERMVDALEVGIAGRSYVAGDHFTAADLYLAHHIGWGLLLGMLPPRPAFEAYLSPIMARPAGLRARAIDDALAAEPA